MVDSVVIPSEPKPESQDHIDKMAAKGTPAVDGVPKDRPQRPDWLPEKFQSVEDMARAYSELEKKLGGPPKDEPKDTPKDEPKAPADNLQVEQRVEAQGFKMSDLQAEYTEKGTLSDETYTKLEKAGFSRNDVDTYIEGRKALVAKVEAEGYAIVGGKDAYEALKDWARTNLKAEEIAAFNKAVSDPTTRELAIVGLNAKFQSSEGRERTTEINANSGRQGASDVYESRAQMIADMNKPEYKTDPAYRQKVAEKLARSKIF